MIAEKYWRDTFWDTLAMMGRGMGEEGGPDEPPKVKTYPGAARRALPQRVPSSLGSAFSSDAFSSEGTPAELDLGALLYYGYGLQRVDVGALKGWPYHRTVPSARCFYPTELYVCLPGDGLFHYDQAHHSLARIRAGDHLATLGAATASDLSGAEAVVILTSHFWKTAFRYRHYAYRLCTQEAGMVAGNVLMVASALGRPGHLHLQFLDEVVDRLLGLPDGEERAVAVLPLYADPGRDLRAGPDRRRADDLLTGIEPVRLPFRDVPKDLSLAGDVYAVDAASVLRNTEDFTVTPGPPARETPSGDTFTDLAAALRARHSGGSLFRPTPGPIEKAALEPLLRHASAPLRGDLGDRPLCTVHHVVQNVEGWESGVYRNRFTKIADLPAGRLDTAVTLGPPVMDATAVNLFSYVVTDRDALTDRCGVRSFRIANIDAGVVAQRIAVLAAAGGLAARPVNGYSTPDIQRLLGLGPEQVPIFQLMVGRRSVSAQYEMPIVF